MVQYRRRKQDWSPRGRAPGDPLWPKFVDSYLETAVWAGLQEDTDREYDATDFSPEAVAKAIEDSNDFILANRADLESVGHEAMHGHDFYLTRSRHGTGFWDRGYGPAGERLSEAARAYGSADVYVGDDRQLHFG